MAKDALRNIKLGIFVVAGTIVLIAALYLIGNQQNIFGNTFQVTAKFHNVNGLMAGNNVRFAGIDVGTVKSIEIIDDSSVNVIMVIEKNIQPYIKKNAIASIGTDGLMGNKLVNINSAGDHAEPVEEGDVLQAVKPIEQDEMVRTLNATNQNMKSITDNLKTITDRINSKNSLWSLLLDTVVADNVKSAIVNIRTAGQNSAVLTGNLKHLSQDLLAGKGSLGALITDTVLSGKINQTVVKFDRISDTVAYISGDLSKIIRNVEQGQGSIGILLKDTSFVHNLNTSVKNINKGTLILNEDLEALRHSWPFRKYFRKKGKEKK